MKNNQPESNGSSESNNGYYNMILKDWYGQWNDSGKAGRRDEKEDGRP